MRADRLLSLLLLLQTKGPMTARELADRLEVSQRTIYRDLTALDTAGVPVRTAPGPGGGCALMDGYRTDLTGLTEAEVSALFTGFVGGPPADLGLSKALQTAWLKITAALSLEQRRDAEHVRQRVHLDAAGWFQPQEAVPHLRVIQEAVWQDRRLHLTYRRGNGTRLERLVDPYGLVAKASVWYLVAAEKGETRVYRVSRVLSAVLSEEQFERPPGFSAATYWADWCPRFEASLPRYPVTVRVAPAAVPILPRLLGEGVNALLERAGPPDADGWIVLSLTFDSPEVARSYLLCFGTDVRVLEPQEVRDGVVDMAARIVASYAR